MFLVENDSTPKWVYVSSEDFESCWEIKPKELIERHLKVYAKIKTKKLLFRDGYTISEVLKIDRINGKPTISK